MFKGGVFGFYLDSMFGFLWVLFVFDVCSIGVRGVFYLVFIWGFIWDLCLSYLFLWIRFVVSIWVLCGFRFGFYLGSMWVRFGFYSGSVWVLFGFYLDLWLGLVCWVFFRLCLGFCFLVSMRFRVGF